MVTTNHTLRALAGSRWNDPKTSELSDVSGGLGVDDDAPSLYGVQLLFGLALCANGLDAFLLCGSAIDRRASNGRPGLALARMLKCPSSPS